MTGISPLSLDLVNPAWVSEVPSPPHDALSAEDRLAHIERYPLSYLGVTKAPEDVPPGQTMGPSELLNAGRRALQDLLDHKVFDLAESPRYFIYRLTADDHTQTGLVCGVAVSDYDNGQVRIHERTKQDRALHLARHLEVVGAQSSPIALAAAPATGLADALDSWVAYEPTLEFTAPDGLLQQIWAVDEPDVMAKVVDRLAEQPLYLIDGHHRAAAASVHRATTVDFGGLPDGAASGTAAPSPGTDWMLAVVFPIEQLRSQAFHRVLPLAANPGLVDDLLPRCRPVSTDLVNGRTRSEIPIGMRDESGELRWFLIDLPLDESVSGASAILANLDAVRIQKQILEPLLGIDETRPKGRLQHRAGPSTVDGTSDDAGCVIRTGELALITRHVTMDQLMSASDNGLVMPPKSTYFLPKVRSGVFLHRKFHI